MDFIKTDQFHSLRFLTALLNPISQDKLQPLQPFLKHKKRRINALSRPIAHITKRTKPYVSEQFPSQESTLSNGSTLYATAKLNAKPKRQLQ